jgi:hypothetical protein
MLFLTLVERRSSVNKKEKNNLTPLKVDHIILMIKCLPGNPSTLDLLSFARDIEIAHGIGSDVEFDKNSKPRAIFI